MANTRRQTPAGENAKTDHWREDQLKFTGRSLLLRAEAPQERREESPLKPVAKPCRRGSSYRLKGLLVSTVRLLGKDWVVC
jgi:hypothetical protein